MAASLCVALVVLTDGASEAKPALSATAAGVADLAAEQVGSVLAVDAPYDLARSAAERALVAVRGRVLACASAAGTGNECPTHPNATSTLYASVAWIS